MSSNANFRTQRKPVVKDNTIFYMSTFVIVALIIILGLYFGGVFTKKTEVKSVPLEKNTEDLEFAVLCYEDCDFKNITSNDVIKFKKGELTKTLFNTITVRINSKEDPTKKFRSIETRNMNVTGTYLVEGSTTPQTITIGANEKLVLCDPKSVSSIDFTCKPAVFK